MRSLEVATGLAVLLGCSEPPPHAAPRRRARVESTAQVGNTIAVRVKRVDGDVEAIRVDMPAGMAFVFSGSGDHLTLTWGGEFGADHTILLRIWEDGDVDVNVEHPMEGRMRVIDHGPGRATYRWPITLRPLPDGDVYVAIGVPGSG